MVYAVAALAIQNLQILQRSKICAHFSDLTKEFKTNVIGMCTYMYIYVT